MEAARRVLGSARASNVLFLLRCRRETRLYCRFLPQLSAERCSCDTGGRGVGERCMELVGGIWWTFITLNSAGER